MRAIRRWSLRICLGTLLGAVLVGPWLRKINAFRPEDPRFDDIYFVIVLVLPGLAVLMPLEKIFRALERARKRPLTARRFRVHVADEASDTKEEPPSS